MLPISVPLYFGSLQLIMIFTLWLISDSWSAPQSTQLNSQFSVKTFPEQRLLLVEWEIIKSCIFFTYICCSLKSAIFCFISTAIVYLCVCVFACVCAQRRLFVADDCRAFVFPVSFLLIAGGKNSHNALWSQSAAALYRLMEEGGVEVGTAQYWRRRVLDTGSGIDAEPGEPK